MLTCYYGIKGRNLTIQLPWRDLPYMVVGDISNTSRTPLVALHGGPGLLQSSIFPLSDLASFPSPIPVIFYDQIGNAHSTHLDDKPESFWTIDFFIDELTLLISMDTRGAVCLLLSSPFTKDTPASRKLQHQALMRCMQSIPEEVQLVLKKQGGKIDTSNKEYNKAAAYFCKQFGTRYADPMLEALAYSLRHEDHLVVLNAMLKGKINSDWDVTDKLHLIRVLTLLLNEKYNFIGDELCSTFFCNINKVKWVQFAQSSHVPHWEERERYMEVVKSFLVE
ncbi:hypothetical protein SERLA73DRAFT_154247 [Serpula lacrymans var. lacrymans S7.3]|uniref:AB hydrolase-1 domain-containing protein n=1 Tax=Serpula lacrymans var. lacrymans (strain S7.3) TaxID=936435 RepID=F8Q3W7_SERL3|nr:hypothetical protein SERLA73DRAFT_154247 [Serpula lacrymans var. lacrymans S7.3]